VSADQGGGTARGVSYHISHTTQYDYSDAVSVSHHVARLTPRTLPHQTCERSELEVEPGAALTERHVDYYGNAMTFFAMQVSHKRLSVRARSLVKVEATPVPRASSSPPWEAAAELQRLPLEAIEFALELRQARVTGAMATYARASFPARRPLLEGVADLTARIHRDFTYDPKATTIATSLTQVFESRRGVCQDFARLEIACLRTLGIPARYVSGYLETVPPPGQLRLVGADASHAWLAVYCPTHGWVDVDPTNNLFPSGTHVTLAWGLDYADVSPIRGVILGGGDHSLKVSVDIARVAASG
jgi:transglutaminase-like putative cysteine protease